MARLRGRMLQAKLAGPEAEDSLHAISSISCDGKTVTAVVYFASGLEGKGLSIRRRSTWTLPFPRGSGR